MKRLMLLAALAVGCGGDTTDRTPGRAPLRLGIAIASYVHAVAWVARDHGELGREGLDAEVQVLGGSSAAVRALIAGNTDVAIVGGDAVLQANAAGADLVVVAGLVDRFYHRVVARDPVTTIEALRGRRVGLPFLGGPQDMAVRFALRRAGLEPGEDVRILNMGRELDRMAALARGDIDATTSQTPPSRLRALGLHVIANLPDEDVPFPYAVVVTRRDYLRTHDDRVRAALAAMCDAASFYRTDRSASLAIVEAHMSGSDVEAAASERYEEMGPSRIALPPRPSEAGFRTVIVLLDDERARAVDPADLFDLRILDALVRQGRCLAP